jgi:hypothetical protein
MESASKITLNEFFFFFSTETCAVHINKIIMLFISDIFPQDRQTGDKAPEGRQQTQMKKKKEEDNQKTAGGIA